MLGSSAVVFPLWIPVAFHAVLFDSVLEVSVSLQVRRELFPISPYVLNEVRFPRIVGEIDGKPHTAPGCVVSDPSRVNENYSRVWPQFRVPAGRVKAHPASADH